VHAIQDLNTDSSKTFTRLFYPGLAGRWQEKKIGLFLNIVNSLTS